MNVEEIYNTLKSSLVEVEFEKMNGDVTKRTFTLSQDLLPESALVESSSKEPQTMETIIDNDVIRAWSISDNGWRSFKPSRVRGWNT
jgi:hypothetical protein